MVLLPVTIVLIYLVLISIDGGMEVAAKICKSPPILNAISHSYPRLEKSPLFLTCMDIVESYSVSSTETHAQLILFSLGYTLYFALN